MWRVTGRDPSMPYVSFMRFLLTMIALCSTLLAGAQSLTSFRTGPSTDTVTAPRGGVCLMGGATENDAAMRWFLRRADGGDVLVLRTSGSDGYNAYMAGLLDTAVHAVETIVFNDSAAAWDPYVHQRIDEAEAIWFAGGDQWRYVSWWQNTPVDSLIRRAHQERNAVIGGTSAGMAILGEHVFTARNGTILSGDVLADPFDVRATVSSDRFLDIGLLRGVLTDSHVDDPDRRGRVLGFMARLHQAGRPVIAIACEEYTAVCIAPDTVARVFGDHPDFDDFVSVAYGDCRAADSVPETCMPGSPLTWSHGRMAVRVYRMPGDSVGTARLPLHAPENGVGGTWRTWWAESGVFGSDSSSWTDCDDAPPMDTTTVRAHRRPVLRLWPNPVHDVLHISPDARVRSVRIVDATGRTVRHETPAGTGTTSVDVHQLPAGIYHIEVRTPDGVTRRRFVR